VGRDPADGTVRRALQSLEEQGAIYRGEDKRWYHRNGRRAGAMTGQLLTADQLADRWQIPKSQVYALTRAGQIPTVKLGRYYRYRLDAIERWESETMDGAGARSLTGTRSTLTGTGSRGAAGMRRIGASWRPLSGHRTMSATTEAGPRCANTRAPAPESEVPMQHKANRRSYGTGSLFITTRADGTRVYYGKFRDASGQQVKRRIGPVRTPHEPDGLTKAQAEARLRDLIATVQADPPVPHAALSRPRPPRGSRTLRPRASRHPQCGRTAPR
jgi:excisionase family DNA binding protein